MTETTTHTFAVGDRVVIENRGDGWNGITGTIDKITSSKGQRAYIVRYDDVKATPFVTFPTGRWTEEAGFLQPLAMEGEKPLLASLKAETSRTYAAKAKSRLLKPHENLILTKASAGHEIDVVAFRKAATAALSLASTRAGQSMARRDWAREARHLIYWADAIIDNHLKGLPVYEGGPRSPRIAELELEVKHLEKANTHQSNVIKEWSSWADSFRTSTDEKLREADEDRWAQKRRVETLEGEISALKMAASDERRRLCDEIDGLKDRVVSETNSLYVDINEANAAIEYAFTLLNAEQGQRLAGFRDGYATRVLLETS